MLCRIILLKVFKTTQCKVLDICLERNCTNYSYSIDANLLVPKPNCNKLLFEEYEDINWCRIAVKMLCWNLLKPFQKIIKKILQWIDHIKFTETLHRLNDFQRFLDFNDFFKEFTQTLLDLFLIKKLQVQSIILAPI